MSQLESGPPLTTFNIRFADASNLPMQYVNAMGIQAGSVEFFFTLGSVVPPEKEEMAAALEAGHLVAQPVFRFALSRDSMEKFLALMAGQYDQQTSIMKQVRQQSSEASQKEVSGNE